MTTPPALLADWQPLTGVDIDWGAFPAWFGAVITSLGVLGALYVILRDRIASNKRIAAGLHVDPIPRAGPGDERVMFVNLYNASPSPIIQPYVTFTPTKELLSITPDRETGVAYLPPPPVEKLHVAKESILEWWLEPESYGQIEAHLPDGDDHGNYIWRVHFRAAGRKWVIVLNNRQRLRQDRPTLRGRARIRLRHIFTNRP